MNFVQKLVFNIYPRLGVLRTHVSPMVAPIGNFSSISIPNMKYPSSILGNTQGTTELTRRLLQPISAVFTQIAGFKVKGRLKRRCKDCYFVMRQQRLYVICKTHPRHKQMAMKAKDDKSWILTHATQSKIRPY